MKIYIASSFKNLADVCALRDTLKDQGHTVFDWTLLAPPIPMGISAVERKRLLDTDERGDIFTFCNEASASADVVIYFGKAGQDAGVEVGMAYAAGVPVIGCLRGGEEAGLMLNGCVTEWVQSVDDLLAVLPKYEMFTFDAAYAEGMEVLHE